MTEVERTQPEEPEIVIMKKVVVLNTVDTGSQVFPTGATAELSADEADRLIGLGSAVALSTSLASSLATAQAHLADVEQSLEHARAQVARIAAELDEANAGEAASAA